MNAGDLHPLVAALAPIDGVSLDAATDQPTVRISFRPEATSEQRAAAQAFVNAFNFDAAILAENKLARYAEIDARSTELRAAGFSYTPVAGSTAYLFPGDVASCNTWTGMLLGRGGFPYPLPVGTVDHQEALLTTPDDVQGFYMAGLARISQILAAGVPIRATITNAATQEALDAIVDDRA